MSIIIYLIILKTCYLVISKWNDLTFCGMKSLGNDQTSNDTTGHRTQASLASSQIPQKSNNFVKFLKSAIYVH